MKPNAKAVRLLRKVIAHIKAQPKRLGMWEWAALNKRSPGGTTACIAGWSIILSQPKPERFIGIENSVNLHALFQGQQSWGPLPGRAAAKLLKIDAEQANRLFNVGEWPYLFEIKYRMAKTARGQASAAVSRIEHFIQTGE